MGKAFLVIDTPHEMVITDPKGEIHAIQAYLEQNQYADGPYYCSVSEIMKKFKENEKKKG